MTPAEYNRHLPLPGSYARSWCELIELVRQDPDQLISVPGFIVRMKGWGRQTASARCVLREVRRALQSRINARATFVPMEPREGEAALQRDKWRIKHLADRVIVRQFESPRVARRLGHLLSSEADYE